MGVLCSLLKLSDPVVGFIAGISQFSGSFTYAFAYNNLMIYLGMLDLTVFPLFEVALFYFSS